VKSKDKSTFALDDSLSAYGIHNNPFPIDETDDYFFSTPALGKQLDALRNLVDYGDLVLVVSGVEGAGKTTLLNQLLLAAEPRWKCCRIDAYPSMTIDAMIDELLEGFGVEARGEDTMADEALLRSHLAKAHTDGGIALLVVDDAHLMPQICMEFLLGLAEQLGDIELRLLLASEPGRLGISTNDPKRVHVVVLKPFDAEQCGDYLHTRLSHAGLVGDSPFGASVVDEIYQDSGGVPGEIHPLAVHTLLANTETTKLRRRTPKSTRAVAYVVLMLLVAGAVALWLRPAQEFEEFEIKDPGATGEVKGRMVTGSPKSGIVVEEPAGIRLEELPAAQPRPDSASVVAEKQPRETQTTSPVAASSDDGVKVFTLDGNDVSTTAAFAVTSPAPAKDDPSVAGSEAIVRLAKNVTPAVTAPVTAPAKSHASHDLDWLRRQNPSDYVIQLVGTRDASAARRFINSHELGDKGTWVATSHQNKPWYVVVYGMYPDNASARAAIEMLPEALRAGSPWPRSVASVIENAR
jgi:DamX protein